MNGSIGWYLDLKQHKRLRSLQHLSLLLFIGTFLTKWNATTVCSIYPFETRGLTSRFIQISILYPYFMLFPHSKMLFRIKFKRGDFSMKTTRLELYHGSFVIDLIQILSLLLWKLVKRLLYGVQARTRTT